MVVLFLLRSNSCNITPSLWPSILLLIRGVVCVCDFVFISFDFLYHKPLINIHLFWILDWLMESALRHFSALPVLMCRISVWFVCYFETAGQNGRKVFDVVEMMLCCLFHLIWFRTSFRVCMHTCVSAGEWIRHLAFGCALLCADLNKLTVIEFNLTSAICCDSAVAATTPAKQYGQGVRLYVFIYWFFFQLLVCVCRELSLSPSLSFVHDNASAIHAHDI